MPEQLTNKHEKMALGAIVFGGLAALILGFAYLGNAIQSPLRLKPGNFKTLEEQELAKQAELRTKDTDQDGIVDYDEIYVYRTSAYLPDTDSDGFGDKVEIESGNDPNCPSGRDCGQGNTGGDATNNQTAENSANTLQNLSNILGQNIGGQDSDFGAINQMLIDMPVEDIRQMLIDNGLSAEMVSQFDDETLVSLYKESVAKALEEARTQGENAVNSGSGDTGGEDTSTASQ